MHKASFLFLSIILHIEVCVTFFPCLEQEYNVCTVNHVFFIHFPVDKCFDLMLSDFVQCTLQITCHSDITSLTKFKFVTAFLKCFITVISHIIGLY